MKTEVLDILIYLFETYLDDDQSDIPNEDSIRKELSRAGFHDAKVSSAFDWLDDLVILKDEFTDQEALESDSLRLFSPLEIEKLDEQARGVLLDLVELSVITPSQRELIIDKALALDIAHIDQEQMKWIILMVLFNLPDSAGSFTWIQDLLYEETPTVH
jgi:Smg protein